MMKSLLHYHIIKKLGKGGMGCVYLAEDTKLKRRVALKFLSTPISLAPAERKRFEQEAQAAAGLNHPNIAQVYAIEECDDELFIVMEYVEGKELKTAIDEGQLTETDKEEVALQMARGIAAAHDKGIIHRDIKSRNIMIDGTGEVKIMDFGLARMPGADHITKTGATLGTTAYMAPELLTGGKASIRSDIWSYGVVLYELFTRQLPFEGLYEPAIMYAITEEEPIPASQIDGDISPCIERVINKCLAKDPALRYRNFSELVADLIVPSEIGERSESSRNKRRFTQTAGFYVGGPAFLMLIGLILFLSLHFSWFGHPIPQKKYLAVLPIENIGHNPRLQAICDGLGEIFSYKLSELEKYKDSYWVASAAEIRKEKVISASQANKRFGVNLAVASSIQTVGDSTRLILALVDAGNMRNLGTEQVIVPSQHLALLEQKAVKAMLAMLHIEMNPAFDKSLKKQKPSNPKAYEFYLRGLADLQNYGFPDSLQQAIGFFRKTIGADSNFALGYAGLGEAYWRKYEITRTETLVPQAKKALARALQLNKDLAPVQQVLGMVEAGTGRQNKAASHFKKALNIDPKYSPAYRGLAKLYDAQGKTNKAVKTYQKAIALKPNYWEGYNDLGIHYLEKGNFNGAITQFQKVVVLTPSSGSAYSNLGAAYYYRGDYENARQAFEKSLALDKNPATANNLAGIYYLEGNYTQAASMYKIALNDYANRYEIWGNLAAAYGLSGQQKKARQSYQTAIEKAHAQLNVNHGDPQVLADLGAYYSDIDDTLHAVQYLSRAIKLDSDNLRVRRRAVSTYEKLDMRAQALKWIDRSMISYIESQPELKSLRDDPKYQKLKAKFSFKKQE